jgi:hypothetical protein
VTWWIVAGVLVLAVVVLAAAVAALLGRLRPLKRAVRRLMLRAEQAQGLQTKIETLQERSVELQARVEETTTRTDHLRHPVRGVYPGLT